MRIIAMKKIVTLTACAAFAALGSTAVNADPGAYYGFGAGYSSAE
jgi:hypothetical protein